MKMRLIYFLFSFFNLTSVNAGVHYCYELTAHPDAKDSPFNSAGIPFEVASHADREAWIGKNLLDLLKTSNLSRSSHAKEFFNGIEEMKDLGFKLESVQVRFLKEDYYVAYAEFIKPTSKRTKKVFVARINLTLSVFDQKFYKSFSIMNSRTEFFGPVERGSDLEKIKTTHQSINRNADALLKKQKDGLWDSRRSSAYIAHIRKVLHELVVPFALRSPDVSEVGIGFPKDAKFVYPYKFGVLPRIIMSRSRRNDELTTFGLFNSRKNPPVSFSGEVPEIVEIGSETSLLPWINRRDSLIVYEEVLDQDRKGRIFAVSRTDGSAQELYYHERTQSFSFSKPNPDDAPPPSLAKVNKLTPGLRNRIHKLEAEGSNPRIKVRITYATDRQGSYEYEEKIISVREIGELSKNRKVFGIQEMNP